MEDGREDYSTLATVDCSYGAEYCEPVTLKGKVTSPESEKCQKANDKTQPVLEDSQTPILTGGKKTVGENGVHLTKEKGDRQEIYRARIVAKCRKKAHRSKRY